MADSNDPRHAVSTPASVPGRLADEFVTWVRTLASAAVYATLIVTFGVQVARVDGQSMAPTLENHDRLLVNKFAYLSYVGEPQVGDLVCRLLLEKKKNTLLNPLTATEKKTVRIAGATVFVSN